MHRREHHTGCGTIALECEAFLNGTLVEYWDEKGLEVPVWAWMNVLAHGSARQIGACIAGPNRLRRAGRSWRIARAYLAFEILDLTDAEFPLVNLQSSVLIPLEAEMASRPEVTRWSPRQWADLVEVAITDEHWALEQ